MDKDDEVKRGRKRRDSYGLLRLVEACCRNCERHFYSSNVNVTAMKVSNICRNKNFFTEARAGK
jgi:hypothetical protein